MSRVDSGRATLTETEGDIYYSFNRIEATVTELAKAKDINITFEFGDIQDRFVYADQEHSNRVFVNIITNAIKYTNEARRYVL